MRRFLLPVMLSFGATYLLAQGSVRQEEVTFKSGDLTLAGTLYLPTSSRRMPAVALIHGSGKSERQELRYYAQLFAKSGVAALAWDKRGVGKSEGGPNAWRNFSLADLASDAAAAVRYLRLRPDVDSAGVGIFGVSQGGWVAPIAAQQSGGVRFVVTVSASLTTIAEDNVFERAARLTREGFSAAEVERARAMHVLDILVSRNGQGFDEFVQQWDANQAQSWFRRVYGDPRPAPPEHPYRTWYRSVMDVDPMPAWRALSSPMLFITGDPALDALSPVARNVSLIDGMRREGHPVERLTLEGADHNLKRGGREVDLSAPLAAWLTRVLGER